jgi:hypothetical protein
MKVRLLIILSLFGWLLPSSVLAGSHQSNQSYFNNYQKNKGCGPSKTFSQQIKDYDNFCRHSGNQCRDYRDFERKFDHYCRHKDDEPQGADLPGFHPVVTGNTLLGFTASASSKVYLNGSGSPTAGITAGTYAVLKADGVTPRGYIKVTAGGAWSWSTTP